MRYECTHILAMTNSYFDYSCLTSHTEEFPHIKICKFEDENSRKTDVTEQRLTYGDIFVFIQIPYTHPLYEDSWVSISLKELDWIKSNDIDLFTEEKYWNDAHNPICDMCNNTISETTYKLIPARSDLSLHNHCYHKLCSNLFSAFDKSIPTVSAQII